MSQMVKGTALRDLKGIYGKKFAGDVFEVESSIAESLEARGLFVRGVLKPKTAEDASKKSTGPVENKAVQPEANKKK